MVIFSSHYYQNMRKGKIFKLVGIRFEKKNKSLKYRESEKHKVKISTWVKNGIIIYLKKCILATEDVILFLAATKRCAKECSSG